MGNLILERFEGEGEEINFIQQRQDRNDANQPAEIRQYLHITQNIRR